MAHAATTTSLTSQQEKALTTRSHSVALSAGAGCGKTFVLTQRFLSHLAEAGADELGRFVAITFTDRAAREMRDRIRRGCQARIEGATDEAVADHWLRLLRELDSARVSTIHSFCGALLRAHAVEAGLDPRFQTLDKTQSATLRSEFLDDAMRALLAQRDRATMELVVQFGLEKLRTMIGMLLDRRQQIDFEWWCGKSPDDVLAIWQQFHTEEVLPATLRQLAESPATQTMLRILREDPCQHKVFLERRQVLLEKLPDLSASQQPDQDLAAINENAKVQGGGTKKNWTNDDLYESYRDAATVLRDQIKKLSPRLTFDAEAARPSAVAGLQLLSIVRPIAEGFSRHKLELGCLDFDDLLIRARDLLYHPAHEELRRRLSSQIKLLLVDESQDTDPLQVELIEALCGDGLTTGKLFFVGDFKQSIYRFRRADPRVFIGLQQRMPPQGRLPLSENFRSQPAILNFVNALFCDAFGGPAGSTNAGPTGGSGLHYEKLVAHRQQTTPTPAIEFLWYTPPDDEKTPVDVLRGQEAEWIARRLRALLDDPQPMLPIEKKDDPDAPPGSLRRVELGDIAILFRALSNVAEYEEALRRHGIDYYLVGGKAFYAQQEVFDLLNLLRALATPNDLVSLAGVLRSPYFSLADETLFWLAQHPGGLNDGLADVALYADGNTAPGAAARQARQEAWALDDEQRRRAVLAARTIAALRELKDRLPIADLIHEALTRTGYDAVLVAEFLGERKLANLHKLIDQARGFDSAGIFTLDDYIAQLAEFVSQQPDEPLAATHPESTDVVRLMSIHQSKGLEFPVVVVPDLNRGLQHSTDAAGFSPRLGPLVKVADDKHQGLTGSDLFAAVESQQDEDERVRLLYVAATRAADYLILSAGLKKLDSPGSPWLRLLAERFDLETGAFLGVLPAGYDAPGPIRVTRTEPPAGAVTTGTPRRSLREMVETANTLARVGAVPLPQHTGPLPLDAQARRQYSFSRLSGALELLDPKLIEEDEQPVTRSTANHVDPLRLGILVHEVLATVPLQGRPDAQALVAQAAHCNAENTPVEISTAAQLLHKFFQSPRFADMAAAPRVYRELEFLLAWPPSAASGGPTPAEGGMYLEGFIDCLYQDAAGNWHLLDYKTNQVSDHDLAATAAGYEVQLQVYALAIGRTFGQLPASCTLHFMRTGQEATIALPKEPELVERIDRAIQLLQSA
ncbi:MAG: UvrD-helicase domain-containing protein [Pirellulales bacterium]